MNYQELLSRPKVAMALGFAIARHGDQKYGSDPYEKHLLQVAAFVYNETELPDTTPETQEIVVAAALLHDILEDTETTEGELKGMFGESVTAIVKACTKTEDDLCRRCAFRKTVQALRENKWALAVKLADRLTNMSKSLQERSTHLNMYVREYAEFKSLLWREGEWARLWAHLDRAFEKGQEKKK